MLRWTRREPEVWENTARVHLVSSFLASVLAGADAPVDVGDGAGMNLLDLTTLAWAEDICEFVAPRLRSKLPTVARPREATALRLAPYFSRYGLRAGIPVAPFTGDNPATLVGTGADVPGVGVISFGTSDTFFAAMPEFRTDPSGCGHVFGNPSGGFMSLVCVKNGSLARDRVRRELGVDWAYFDETAFEEAPRRADALAFPFFETEITPPHEATGIEARGIDWTRAAKAEKIRAVVEAQVQNLHAHAAWMGSFDVVRLAGGASRSRGLRETVAAVFGARVETLETTDAAALGGAILAERIF